jgi:hypothetical protein
MRFARKGTPTIVSIDVKFTQENLGVWVSTAKAQDVMDAMS